MEIEFRNTVQQNTYKNSILINYRAHKITAFYMHGKTYVKNHHLRLLFIKKLDKIIKYKDLHSLYRLKVLYNDYSCSSSVLFVTLSIM